MQTQEEVKTVAKKPSKRGEWKRAVSEKVHNIVVLYFVLSILTVVGFAAGIRYGVFEGKSIVIENANAAGFAREIAKEEAPKEKVLNTEELVDLIYLKESSRGVKNYSKCEAIGKYNRYGFGIPGNGQYVCFEKDQDRVAATGWVAHKKALGMSDNALLCLYNTGEATESCGYIN